MNERFIVKCTRCGEEHTTEEVKPLNVEDSVWAALTWMYDEDVARLLKYQYCEVKL